MKKLMFYKKMMVIFIALQCFLVISGSVLLFAVGSDLIAVKKSLQAQIVTKIKEDLSPKSLKEILSNDQNKQDLLQIIAYKDDAGVNTDPLTILNRTETALSWFYFSLFVSLFLSIFLYFVIRKKISKILNSKLEYFLKKVAAISTKEFAKHEWPVEILYLFLDYHNLGHYRSWIDSYYKKYNDEFKSAG